MIVSIIITILIFNAITNISNNEETIKNIYKNEQKETNSKA